MELRRLGDLVQFINGDRSKNYPSGLDIVKEGIPFISATDIDKGRVELDRAKRITRKAYDRLRSGKIEPGDILYCLRGTIGKIGLVRDFYEGAIASSLTIVRPKEDVEGRFIYYFLSSPNGQQAAFTLNNGSAQPNISVKAISELRVGVPSFLEQREIAAILGALDDKIELNRKTSATLEAMAQAIYRSWFVDFDPVHARSQGRTPAHMDKETAALFPDRFGDTGLPEGWGWRAFERHYTVLETGKRPKGGIGSVVNGVPSIGAESIKKIGSFDFAKTKFVPRAFFEKMKKGHLSDGDILIYKDGGKPGELRPAATYVSEKFPFEEACINEHVFRVRIDEELGQYFGFLALSSDHCMQQMRELATGVAQPGLNQSAMKALSFLMPSEGEILKSFNRLVAPLLDGCNEKARESLTLATLRDTLLPRLMSGELRVGEAREQVEALV